MSVPGVGPIISSAMVAAIGTGDVFTKGRDFAAWLGLVPKQISTGDRTILGKISRRHGLKPWIEAARKRLHHNVLAMGSPTSSPASPGAFWRTVAHSKPDHRKHCKDKR